MSPDLQNQLYVKYPEIFQEKDAPMSQTAMCWGCQHDDGWFDILDHLCASLTNLYSTGYMIKDEFFSIEPPQVIFTTVKEKFGTLRVYHRLEFAASVLERASLYPDVRKIMDSYESYVDGMIHMAETMSGRICEDTGQSGELHVSGGTISGWYRTLNREYAKTDPKMVERNYVPVSGLSNESDNEARK